jgi:hypothetical protein
LPALLDRRQADGTRIFATVLASDKALSLSRLSILAQGRGDVSGVRV